MKRIFSGSNLKMSGNTTMEGGYIEENFAKSNAFDNSGRNFPAGQD